MDRFKNRVILIVDDNPLNLSVLASALKEADFKTRVAVDADTAIRQAQENPPDLILMDIQMPGTDGFEACRRLKQIPKTKNIPLLFITAYTDIEDKVKGLSLGAVDYITKPFHFEEVLARVKVHLEIKYLNQKVLEQSIELQKANQELQRLANLDGLTEVANRRRLDHYLEQEWKRISQSSIQEYLSLIMCDIDYFKHFNDFYGHQAGDECLKRVVACIVKCMSHSTGLVARYGGEEFAVVITNDSPQSALQIGDFIRESVKFLRIEHSQSATNQFVSISVGIGSLIPSKYNDPSSLILIADKALYKAKNNGRNQTCLELNSA